MKWKEIVRGRISGIAGHPGSRATGGATTGGAATRVARTTGGARPAKMSSSGRPPLNAAALSLSLPSSELPAKSKPSGSATKIGWKTSQRCSTIKEIADGNLEGGIVMESRTLKLEIIKFMSSGIDVLGEREHAIVCVVDQVQGKPRRTQFETKICGDNHLTERP